MARSIATKPSLLISLILITAFAGATLAAPAASYFPLTSGATWVRRATDGAQVTVKVTGSKTVGAARCTIVETTTVRNDRQRTTRVCYAQRADAVQVIETEGRDRTIVLDPPRSILQLPPRAGKSWTWTPRNLPVEMTVTDTWAREETVKVTAGTFRAWKLKSVTKRGDVSVTLYTWYAAGVGIVKIVREEVRGEMERDRGSELVSYRIP